MQVKASPAIPDPRHLRLQRGTPIQPIFRQITQDYHLGIPDTEARPQHTPFLGGSQRG